MCVVSAVHDYGRQHSDDWWSVGRWHEFQDLIKQAEKFDKATGQPHCEDPEKIAFMKRIEERIAKLEKTVADAMEKAVSEADPAPVPLYGSSILPSEIIIGETPLQLGEIVSWAYSRFDGTATDWNALPELEREALLAQAIYELRRLHAEEQRG